MEIQLYYLMIRNLLPSCLLVDVEGIDNHFPFEKYVKLSTTNSHIWYLIRKIAQRLKAKNQGIEEKFISTKKCGYLCEDENQWIIPVWFHREDVWKGCFIVDIAFMDAPVILLVEDCLPRLEFDFISSRCGATFSVSVLDLGWKESKIRNACSDRCSGYVFIVNCRVWWRKQIKL